MAIANQINIQSLENREKELKQLLNEFVELSLTHVACQKSELYQLEESRENFFMIDIWKNDKKRKAFLESSEYKDLYKKIEDVSASFSLSSLKLPQCLTKLGLK
jgi:quinol monooxygenase YgiN